MRELFTKQPLIIMDYNTLAPRSTVEKTAEALQAHGFKTVTVNTGAEALEYITKTIPADVSIMNGTSTTLQQIGYIEYLKAGKHEWNNLHSAVLAEKDSAKQAALRKHAVVSDYYLGSVHAVTETGELVFASASGSQLPHLAYTSSNLILVVSTKKIVPTIPDAFNRIDTYIVPLEDVRMKEAYGYGTAHLKTLILRGESASMGRSVQVVFVNEKLGF